MQVCELNQYDYVLIAGPDSISFLQGQVTCDMTQLTDEQGLSGALCNLKGRVIGDFLCVRTTEGCLLQISDGNGHNIAQTLSKYAVFSQVEISIHRRPCAAFGIVAEKLPLLHKILPAPPSLSHHTATSTAASIIKLAGSPGRFQLWVWKPENVELITEILRDKSTEGVLLDTNQWDYAEILSGRAHVSAQSSEEFTPQLLNYDLSGVVNFGKGCYTGQEVVARMHYKAEAKKRMFLLFAKVTSEALSAESELKLTQHNRLIKAPVVQQARGPGNTTAMLAILPAAIGSENEQILLEQNPDLELTVRPLRYT
tara:strand:+ start:67 stop:1002 length:936 start_codon:yes stop_codon:yes gene_type:complete